MPDNEGQPEGGAAVAETPPEGASAKKFFGKYETEEEAAKGFQELQDSYGSLKEDYDSNTDTLLQLQTQVQDLMAKQPPEGTTPSNDGAQGDPGFRREWNEHNYEGAVEGKVKGAVDRAVEAALKKVQESQSFNAQQLNQMHADIVVKQFEADTRGHPHFADMRPEIDKLIAQRSKQDKDWGKGWDPKQLLHNLYLEVRDANPDAFESAKKRAAVAAGGAGGAPGADADNRPQIKPIESRKLPRKSWSVLGLNWNPKQYRLSHEDQRAIRDTYELEALEIAARMEKERILKAAGIPALPAGA